MMNHLHANDNVALLQCNISVRLQETGLCNTKMIDSYYSEKLKIAKIIMGSVYVCVGGRGSKKGVWWSSEVSSWRRGVN